MLNVKHLPVLMYHHVSRCPGLVTLSPETFHEQMKWLAENNWRTVTSAELEYFYQGGKLPRKSVMITFDDGYLDNWLQAWPILKEYNLHAHIFLISGLIGEGKVRHTQEKEYSHIDCEQLIADNRPDEVMLRWSEIRKMHDSGLVEFHVHTHSHKRWDRLSASRTEQCRYMREDILEGKRCLTEKLGSCSSHLCWPEGYYNKDYINLARELGFSYLYTTERRMNCPENGSLKIGRISTKEREHSGWLKRRLFYYTTPFFSSLLALHKGPRLPDN
ncbi:polysaccharide deacetylase family protein [Escherichia albertii]|uniref:polysaccharide deacetylase family protein n=1 Tax=Escherichia albertii TaxID=208962 RepID=UPI000743CB22|nr:polysaccharide deacetylase family protein [Escherichia albertii]EHK6581824.1 polysaccharide deacetylase family protein [Escherichia albertii]EHW5313376.1 polysaccharide deacetylase family protein [Escherichia albertii]EHW5858579.1 polysaccharide deacetylase family protein [Escherichia albertii]MCU7301777.1 polysaccharide deacetylase family protein [Escherichia albertii]MCV3220608.1 polysaccharide deacetylase family protein [Escherichia albertii]